MSVVSLIAAASQQAAAAGDIGGGGEPVNAVDLSYLTYAIGNVNAVNMQVLVAQQNVNSVDMQVLLDD